MTNRLELAHRQLTDLETGEVVEVRQIVVRSVDTDFDKVWVAHLAIALDLIGNKSVRILSHMITTRNVDNLIIATYPKIAKGADCNVDTVRVVVKALIENSVIQRVQNGVYRLNPALAWRGSADARQGVLVEWRCDATPAPDAVTERDWAEREVADAERRLDDAQRRLTGARRDAQRASLPPTPERRG